MARGFRGTIIILGFLLIYTVLGHGHSHEKPGHSHEEPAHFKYSKTANEPHAKETPIKSKVDGTLWLNAMGSTLLISVAPFFIMFFIPLDNTESKQPLLKVLLAFASGGLLGDAFLHLIPHATIKVEERSHNAHSHGEHAHDMSVGLWVLAGIVAFLIVEKTVRILKGAGKGHAHSHKPLVSKHKTDKGDGVNEQKANKTEDVSVAGYLNLAADFSHNFTDGLAIGSSFLAGNTVGFVTTITILLHEVPHEIGDIAILLQAGVSRRNALLLQLTTALGALAGTALSLLMQENSNLIQTDWILPFTAGGFIYIALVSVIPELLDEEKPGLMQAAFQVIALLLGVYMMMLIADYE